MLPRHYLLQIIVMFVNLLYISLHFYFFYLLTFLQPQRWDNFSLGDPFKGATPNSPQQASHILVMYYWLLTNSWQGHALYVRLDCIH